MERLGDTLGGSFQLKYRDSDRHSLKWQPNKFLPKIARRWFVFAPNCYKIVHSADVKLKAWCVSDRSGNFEFGAADLKKKRFCAGCSLESKDF